MIRTTLLILATLTVMPLAAGTAAAQVFVRAPFVRVETGEPGVYVRAPFVNLWIPNGPPRTYLVPPPAATQTVPAPPAPSVFQVQPQTPAPAQIVPPAQAPRMIPVQPRIQAPAQTVPPPQANQVRYPTLGEFARTFQPTAGVHDVVIVNPLNNQPTAVRFTLPDGSPRRVIVEPDEIEFRYGLLQFVRIEFRSGGVTIVAR